MSKINYYHKKDKDKNEVKSLQGFLIILIVSAVIVLGVFKGLEIGSQKLGTYLYSETAGIFLALNR